jgi:DNA-binding MarR family transcriptional regulator
MQRVWMLAQQIQLNPFGIYKWKLGRFMEEKITQGLSIEEVKGIQDALVNNAPSIVPATATPDQDTDSGETCSDQASEIVSSILKAAHRLRGILNSYYAEFGLTDIRFAVLQIIKKADINGCTQSELAEQLQQSESSISTLVDRMRNSDLIYRLRSKSDRRKRVLILSDRGRIILDKVEACHNEYMDKLLKPFQEDQKIELATLLQKLVKHLTFRNGQPEEGIKVTLELSESAKSEPEETKSSAA